MGFTFGGMFLAVLVQAAMLQLCLKLIAKHEADTSYTKALLVVAGASIGQIIVFVLVAMVYPLAALPAVFLFTAVVIMVFCWISFWKSVLVVIIYVLFQALLGFILALIVGSAALLSTLGMQSEDESAQTRKPYRSPMQQQQEQMLQMQQEAIRLQQKAMQQQAELQKKAMEAEGMQPATPVQPPPQPRELRRQKPPPAERPEPAKQDPEPQDADPEWKAAKENLTIGGTMTSGGQYLALINGRMVGAGDVVRAEYRGRTFRWRIKQVQQDDIDMEAIDAK